jgi:hypothetical protein
MPPLVGISSLFLMVVSFLSIFCVLILLLCLAYCNGRGVSSSSSVSLMLQRVPVTSVALVSTECVVLKLA